MRRLFGRGLFGILLFFMLGSSLLATTTVTGHITDLSGTAATSSFVRFTLKGCGGNQPTVNGTAIFAPTQGSVWYKDFPANATGDISGTIYSTRDVTGLLGGDITCGGSTTAVWYGMTVWQAGKSGPEVAVHAKNTATLNVSSVLPITTTPVVTAPTGDTTYLRIDTANSPLTGNLTSIGTISDAGGTHSGTETFTGSVLTKQFELTNWYADQYCAGSIDVSTCINNTLAVMPSFSGYKFGTIRLDGFAPGTVWTWNTLVTISSPYVSIIGPGSAALEITASVLTGDHLRINTSPFIVSLAGQFGGFAIVAGSQSNAVCVHVGDIIGPKFSDLRCSNFTGTGAVGLWEDNVTNFTERVMLDKVHLDSCTKGIKLTNTGNVAGTASFGHQRWTSVWINVGANQTGISYESGTLYSGTFNITANLNATTSTAVAISGLAYAAGPSTAWTGSLLNLNAETSAGSGTLFNVAAGSSVLVGGVVTTGGGLTNTGTGTLNIYPGNAITNADFSNTTFAAGVLVIGGAPQATNIPQFNANSASAIAGVTASNYYLLRAGVAGLEAHDTSGNVGIAGFHSAVSGYRCAVAGACDAGTTLFPFGSLWLGTSATNNFRFQAPATAAARVISWTDPLGAANWPFTNNTSTTTTQVMHATATAGLYTTSAIVTADIATALTTPGPIGGTTPSTGKFTTITETNLLVSNTAPTITGAGCGGSAATISANNGTAAFSIGTGTAPTSACTVTMPAATTGWVCDANTVSATTTTNFIVKQTGAVSTTSVVLTLFTDVAALQNYTASDTIRVKCMAY